MLLDLLSVEVLHPFGVETLGGDKCEPIWNLLHTVYFHQNHLLKMLSFFPFSIFSVCVLASLPKLRCVGL